MTPGASGQDLIAEHLERFEQEASEVSDRAQWDELRLRWIGRKQGLVKELLSRLRDLPAEQREAWREIFNYYVFDFDRSKIGHIPEERRGPLGRPVRKLDRRRGEHGRPGTDRRVQR